MKRIILVLCIILCSISQAQEKPKLVVGIIVDQMRYDYIYRFWSQFGDNGFKKLVNEMYEPYFSYSKCQIQKMFID